MTESYKSILSGVMAGVVGWLDPIAMDVFTLFYIFVANFATGYLCGKIVYKEDWDNKKALRCLGEAAMFFVVVVSIYGIGEMKHIQNGAAQCVSTVVYVVMYFYTTNILKNLRKLLVKDTPAWKVIDALYYLLSFEIVKSVPLLKEYLTPASEEHEREASR